MKLKGITEEINFMIKIITIIILVLSILGTYFTIIEYKVSKDTAGVKKEALIIAESFLNCREISDKYSLLNENKLLNKNKTKLGCIDPFNDVSEIVVDTGSSIYAFGNMVIDTSGDPEIIYAAAIKTSKDIIPGVIKIYLS